MSQIFAQGLVCPLDKNNVETDQIIPKQFLKRIERTGFGQFLFFDWRYLEDGTTPNPEFELNSPSLAGAEILVANKNFGCGSSREHAPWSLLDYGFRALIAPSYADIFNNNCFQNGILPVPLIREMLALNLLRTLPCDPPIAPARFCVSYMTETPDMQLDALVSIARQTLFRLHFLENMEEPELAPPLLGED